MARTLLAAAFVVTTAVTGYAAPTPTPTAPPGPVAVTTCGQTVTSDAYLARDLTCPTDIAVVLAGDGVDLDLRGHVLRGSRESNGVVLPGWENHTISNGTIRGFSAGVSTTEVDVTVPEPRVRLQDVVLRENWFGLDASFTSRVLVTGGRVVDNDFGLAGGFQGYVEVTGGTVFRGNGVALDQWADVHGATFTRNDVVAECSDGWLSISESRITRNTAVFGSTFRCAPTLERSFVAHNDVVLPVAHDPSVTARVVDNEFRDNGVVIDAFGPVEAIGNTFVRNDVAVRSPLTGVPEENPDWVWPFVTLTDNVFLRNGDAIDVLSPGVLTGNRVERSTGWGIHAPNVADGGGNTASRNGREPQCTGVVCG
ncbi:hypothetical protein AB6N24_06820 [Cellulomonas sp. 179-A 4D5 NHS]|uniref:hypothetical protein n=1 Tax=Cellulomonas sp. 179-A 4D5 NHS TaxID=3142378 RepID=UPI0039A0863B